METINASPTLKTFYSILSIVIFSLLPNSNFAQFSRLASEIEHKEGLKRLVTERVDFNGHKSSSNRLGKKIYHYSYDGKIDSIYRETAKGYYKETFYYDSVKMLKRIYFPNKDKASHKERIIIYDLNSNNILIEYIGGYNEKNFNKNQYNEYNCLTVKYTVRDGHLKSVQKKEYTSDSLILYWLKHELHEKIKVDESIYSASFLDDLNFDTLGHYKHSSVNDTLITYKYRKGKLGYIHKEFKDSSIYYSKLTDIDSDSSYTHYFEIKTDTTHEFKTITFDKKDNIFIPYEVSHSISTPHYSSTIINAYGGVIEPKNETIIYLYTYDRQGNWTLKEALKNDLIIYKEIRTFEYY